MTAGDKSEEGGDDVKSSCPLCLGLHTYYNGYNKEKRDSDVEQNSKKQSQFGLKAEIRLHEAGIASNGRSAYCREYVPGPCTHRPSHHESWEYPKPVSQLFIEAAVEGRINDWGEVVTRQPYRKVRLDHLLSKEKLIRVYYLFFNVLYSTLNTIVNGAVAQLARAPALQAGGQEFDSPQLHQLK